MDISTLQAKTDTELKTLVTADMTKRDLLVKLVGSEVIPTEPVRKYRLDKQIESEYSEEHDVETNALLKKRTTLWTYYKTGEVDTITITETDALGYGTKKVIKHYLDRQPTVTASKVTPLIKEVITK